MEQLVLIQAALHGNVVLTPTHTYSYQFNDLAGTFALYATGCAAGCAISAKIAACLSPTGWNNRNNTGVVINKDRKLIPVSFNANVYCNSEGVVQGVFAIARDMRK